MLLRSPGKFWTLPKIWYRPKRFKIILSSRVLFISAYMAFLLFTPVSSFFLFLFLFFLFITTLQGSVFLLIHFFSVEFIVFENLFDLDFFYFWWTKNLSLRYSSRKLLHLVSWEKITSNTSRVIKMFLLCKANRTINTHIDISLPVIYRLSSHFFSSNPNFSSLFYDSTIPHLFYTSVRVFCLLSAFVLELSPLKEEI